MPMPLRARGCALYKNTVSILSQGMSLSHASPSPANRLTRLPGSLVGAALEHRMGRKEAMYISTFATSAGVFGFVFVSSQAAVMLVSIWISFTGTLMYAIICRRHLLPPQDYVADRGQQMATHLACFP